jgi:hypothetical protein
MSGPSALIRFEKLPSPADDPVSPFRPDLESQWKQPVVFDGVVESNAELAFETLKIGMVSETLADAEENKV